MENVGIEFDCPGVEFGAGGGGVGHGLSCFFHCWVLLVVWFVTVVGFVCIDAVLRVTLLPFAFLALLVSVVFGFVLDAPNFPAWGMLTFSMALFGAYGLFLLLRAVTVGLPRD